MSRWFAAVLVVRSRIQPGWDDDPLFDCQVRLLEAPTPEVAYENALALGKQEECAYKNEEGNDVQWEFLGLHDLAELDEAPKSGGEVYSWLTRQADAFIVVPKERLTVFWLAANADRRAADLLE